MAVLSCGVVSAGSRSLVRALVALLFIIAAASGAGAQAPTAAPAAADVRLGSAARQERLGLHHIRYSGAVEIELVSQGIRFSADVADYFDDEHRLIAVGNVVFVTPSSRISADKADFDTRSRTGTFFNAFGSASVSDKVDKSYFGSQEPDAFFYGETIQKIGVDRYRIHKGAFTTCVQPTPRWEVAADTVTLTIDKRAVLKNAVLKVKDVPLFYIPAMYYPINKEDRSTGFLLPVYGTSTIRGTSFSNAFFWAINRSQDLTVMHDWFTRTGQGYGGEYRYVASAGSNGEFRMYRLNERASTFEQNGTADHPAGPQELRDPHQRRAGPPRRVQGPRQRRLLQRRDGPAAVPDGPLQRDAAHPQLPGQRVGLARPGQLDQRDLRHQRDLLRRRRLADDRRPAAHPVQPGPDQARGAAPLLHRQRRVRQHRPLRQLRRRQDQRPEPDPLRHQPVAAVPADEVAVPVGALVDHVAEHLLDREPRHQLPAGRGADLPSVLRHARQRHRPHPHQGLADAGHRLRRALQARRRAGVQRSSAPPSSTTTTRSSRSTRPTTPSAAPPG